MVWAGWRGEELTPRRRAIVVIALGAASIGVAWLAGRLWFPLGPAVAYSSTAVAVAATRAGMRKSAFAIGCLAMAACLVGGWADLPENDAPFLALVLVLPAVGSMATTCRYVAGASELLAVEMRPRYWRRAAIASGIAFTIGLVVWASVLLGLRADRVDRVDESIDRANAGLGVIVDELGRHARVEQGEAPRFESYDWERVLTEGAVATGRSLMVLGPSREGEREVLAAAMWTKPPAVQIRFTTSRHDLPDDLVERAVAFAKDPASFQRIDVAWRYGSDDLPTARPIPATVGDTRTAAPSGAFNVSGTWTDKDPFLIVSLPASRDEWWNPQGEREYIGSAVAFFIWIDIALVALSMVLMTVLDSRSGLLASLHAEQQRAALRRDAHDRVYNRLAAIAHTLETEEGDRAVGRNASFEILSAVAYLQRILDGEPGKPQRTAEAAMLRRQLEDVVQSAERLWGMKVAFTATGDEAVDQKASWDIQCVVDEALSNAGEHGRAVRAKVDVEVSDGRARIVVHDDGTWVGAASPTSTGLNGLRERLVERGGFLVVEHDEHGTTVVAELTVGAGRDASAEAQTGTGGPKIP